MRAAFLSILLCASTAVAAPFDANQTLDVYSGPVAANARIMGLAGAFVGVAEGQDGQLFNATALAQRRRDLARSWDWDFVLTFFFAGASRLLASGRLHGTCGFDVRIPLFVINARASIAADFASRYQNVSLSVGLWHEMGPHPGPWSLL